MAPKPNNEQLTREETNKTNQSTMSNKIEKLIIKVGVENGESKCAEAALPELTAPLLFCVAFASLRCAAAVLAAITSTPDASVFFARIIIVIF